MRGRPVLCLNTGEVWKSPTEAQKMGQGDVIKAVRLERMAGGNVWKLADSQLSEKYWGMVDKLGTVGPFKLADPDDFEEEIFIVSALRSQVHSQQEVAKKNSERMKKLWQTSGLSMRHEAKQRSEMLKQILSDPEKRAKMSAAKNGVKRPVMNTETGIVYESSHDAARKAGVRQSWISNVCRGLRRGAWAYAVPEPKKEVPLTPSEPVTTKRKKVPMVALDPIWDSPVPAKNVAETNVILTQWVTTTRGRLKFESAKMAQQKGYGDVKTAIETNVLSGGYKWRYMTLEEVQEHERIKAVRR